MTAAVRRAARRKGRDMEYITVNTGTKIVYIEKKMTEAIVRAPEILTVPEGDDNLLGLSIYQGRGRSDGGNTSGYSWRGRGRSLFFNYADAGSMGKEK